MSSVLYCSRLSISASSWWDYYCLSTYSNIALLLIPNAKAMDGEWVCVLPYTFVIHTHFPRHGKNRIQVVGSILSGGGGRKEKETRRCQSCERENSGRSSPTQAGYGGGKGWGGEGLVQVEEGGGGEGAASLCRHKHVDFAPLVSAVYIPVHSEYR